MHDLPTGGGKTSRYVPIALAQEWAWTLQRQEMDPDEIVWQALEEDDMNPDTMRWRPPEQAAQLSPEEAWADYREAWQRVERRLEEEEEE